MKSFLSKLLGVVLLFFVSQWVYGQSEPSFLQFQGGEGPGQGKHIVLIAGDDEYRSEESMPMLAKIFSQSYGFKTSVLFPIDPSSGDVVPSYQWNIPGMEQLQSADLVILLIRFRELPDVQSRYLEEYLLAGKPILGLRTSTHAFAYQKDKTSPYAKWDWMSKVPGWEQGFGKRIFGETWVNHHGVHGKEGTRALVNGVKQEANHPILRGVKDIWGPSDVYGIRNLPSEAEVFLYGQSTAGMDAQAPLIWEKSLMPIAWVKPYRLEEGKPGLAFATTMGASLDFLSADLRRLVVNASFWLLGMGDAVKADLNVDYVGTYRPTPFGFDTFRKGMRVKDFN
ncbi:MAG: hypothetical protein RL407_2015 [Bacteroidota bacterium]|jgi:Trehalose utilisation